LLELWPWAYGPSHRLRVGTLAPNWLTTREIVLMAALSAVSAVAYAGLGQVWALLTAATGPIGGVAIAFFQIGHLIAGGLIPKPGVVFVTSVLSTVVQAFLGDPAGIYVIGWGITHGIGAEAIFLLMRGYGDHRLAVFCIAAGTAAVFGHFYSYALYGWEGAAYLFLISIPLLFVTSAIESGASASWIVRAVERARASRH